MKYVCAQTCNTGQANSAWQIYLTNGKPGGIRSRHVRRGPTDGGQETDATSSIADGNFHEITFIRDVDAMRLSLLVDGADVTGSPATLDPKAAGALNADGIDNDEMTNRRQHHGAARTTLRISSPARSTTCSSSRARRHRPRTASSTGPPHPVAR
jgi:hypothetical protein